MQMAFEEAKLGKSTWTNPQVGALIIKDGKILAKGHHEKFGGPHAEVNTLNNLDDIKQAQGATMYVTLEPCSHFGKTPPCVQKVVEVGIKKVVIGMQDPNPIVSGNGIKYLREHNVAVELLDQTGDINQAYIFYYQHQRPLITIKYAMTLDGKINQKAGVRSIISGQESYQDSQKLRSENQAILIGERTLKIDDPMLTVRKQKLDFPPIRVVLVHDIDQLPEDLKIFQPSDSKVYFLSQKQTSRELPSNIEVQVDPKWNINKIIEFLRSLNIESLLIEGGSQTQADFIQQKLVDKLVVYLAPKIFGGNALSAVSSLAAASELDFQQPTVSVLGSDLKIETRRKS